MWWVAALMLSSVRKRVCMPGGVAVVRLSALALVTACVNACGTVDSDVDAAPSNDDAAVSPQPDSAIEAGADALPEGPLDAHTTTAYRWMPDGERTASLVFGDCLGPTSTPPILCDAVHVNLLILTTFDIHKKVLLKDFSGAQAQGYGVEVSEDRSTVIIRGWGACGGDELISVTAQTLKCTLVAN
jgi:hypothetical protein